MTTVKDVLIFEALENAKKYREAKKLKLLESKRELKIKKARETQVNTVAKMKNRAVKVQKSNIIRKVKKKTKTRSQLVKELDTIFSRYIRLRDADKNGICTCITCGDKKHRKEMQNCHFRSRSCYKYRWSEKNCFSGCYKCNVILNGNYIQYTLVMIDKFGKQRVENIMSDKELIKISTPDLKLKIDEYKEKVINLEKSLAITN